MARSFVMLFLFFAQQLCNQGTKCIYIPTSLSLPQKMYVKANIMSV